MKMKEVDLYFKDPTQEQIENAIKEKPYLNEAWTIDIKDEEDLAKKKEEIK